jgi:hypothetical protein
MEGKENLSVGNGSAGSYEPEYFANMRLFSLSESDDNNKGTVDMVKTWLAEKMG